MRKPDNFWIRIVASYCRGRRKAVEPVWIAAGICRQIGVKICISRLRRIIQYIRARAFWRILLTEPPSHRAAEPPSRRAAEPPSRRVYTLSGSCQIAQIVASAAYLSLQVARNLVRTHSTCKGFFCAALLAALAIPTVSDASLTSAEQSQHSVIRCPDWQRYAPTVALVTDADRQTERTFRSRAGSVPDSFTSPAQTSCNHIIVRGDTLARIAAQKLGSADRWGEIVRRNPGIEPRSLRVGTELDLGCGNATEATAASGAEKGRAGDSAPLAGTGFLARMFGTQQAGQSDAAESTDRNRAADQAEPTGKPQRAAPPPPPVWSARKGEYLADVLQRWGKEASWTVLIDTTDAWHLAVPVRIEAAFDAAIAELVRGLGHDGTPPRVRLYPNRVLRLGGPL